MPLRYTKRILDHLAHANYEPEPADAIADDMNIPEEDRGAFHEAVSMLVEEKKLLIGKDKRVQLPEFGDEVVGELRLNRRGFGFVRPDTPFTEGDLFIPPGDTRDAISGDRVRARVVKTSRRSGGGKREGRIFGRIIEVLDRGNDAFVGVLVKQGTQWLMQPDGKLLRDAVIIRDPHAKNAKAGDKIVVELVHYPEGDYLAEGVITKVLGEAGRPDIETEAVIIAHGLHTDFGDNEMNEARAATRRFDTEPDELMAGREDLRQRFIFTIDPPDAKDFDDAISIEYDERRDQWELGVHIADVSEFVQHDGALDKEARERGNSVYLPRLVLPMLPEMLSNGVCSLQEQVDRLTKSAFITFDGSGKVIAQRYASTVIKSQKRLTYLEAQAIIDGDLEEAAKHARTEPEYPIKLREKLHLSDRLAKILEARRLKDGMIVLALPEVELIFDDDGHVTDAEPEDNAYTHKIIEMFMVEANEAVARLFSNLNIPVLRRVHPEPVHGDIEELQMYARAAKWKLPDEPSRRDLQALLEATRHTPAARAVHFAVLRTLSKAEYSPALIGHFALASEHYLHFTSPIRRYPDLTAHRALAAVLERSENGQNIPKGAPKKTFARKVMKDKRVHDESELVDLGAHCSTTEVEAEAAERELRDFLVMQFLQEKHIGGEFPGVVTGITGGGVFVSIEKFLVEGMVKTADLPQSSDRPDRWRINDATGRLQAARSGASIGIGDIVTVQIAAVMLASRQLDLLMTKLPAPPAHLEEENRGPKSRHERKSKGKSKTQKGREKQRRDKGKRKRR